jgi:hypothetical protein
VVHVSHTLEGVPALRYDGNDAAEVVRQIPACHLDGEFLFRAYHRLHKQRSDCRYGGPIQSGPDSHRHRAVLRDRLCHRECRVSITASGSAQTFSSDPGWGGFTVGEKLSIGLGSDQEYVTITAVSVPSGVTPGNFTAVFANNHTSPAGITPAILYGSAVAVDDVWAFDPTYNPNAGT